MRHADDVAVHVALAFLAVLHVAVDARVGSVCAHVAVYGAVAVVGQRHVEVAGAWVDATPLRAVHLGCADRVGSQTGEDGHVSVGLELEVGVGCNDRVVHRQLNPGASAVVLEACDKQSALVEVLVAHSDAVARVGVSSVPLGCGHKLVHVFTAGIVTHVGHDRLARHGLGKAHAFVGESAQAGALAHQLLAVVGVHFHHETEGVHFVAVVSFRVGGQRAVVPAHKLVVSACALPAMATGSTGRAAVAHQASD